MTKVKKKKFIFFLHPVNQESYIRAKNNKIIYETCSDYVLHQENDEQVKDVAIFSPGPRITIRFLSNCIINNNYEDMIADSKRHFLNLEKSIIISQHKRSSLLTLLEYFSYTLRILVERNRSTKVVL